MPWIRVIDPEQELKRLNVRDRISPHKIAKQRGYPENGHDTDDEYQGKKGGSNYTRMSAFHYVQYGIGQSLYANMGEEDKSSLIGIIVDCQENMDRQVLFRKWIKCVVTDEIFKKNFKSDEEYKEALRRYGIKEVTEKEAKKWTELLFKKTSNDPHHKKNPDETVKITWTEGLFRHTVKDISSIYINPKSPKSCFLGYCFARALEKYTGKRFDFFSYNSDNGNLTKVDREDVKSNFTKCFKNESKANKAFSKTYSKYEEILGKDLEVPSSASVAAKAVHLKSSKEKKGRS